MRLPPKLVYDFIALRLKSGEAPTIREMCNRFDRSPATVHAILLRLENRGLIERTREWRGIKLTEKS